MRYGLIGKPLAHSFSREIHEMLGRYEYEPVELEEHALEVFLARREFCGVNVTIPYKEAVIPHLDALSEEAKRIGAVNTIVNRDGRLYGHNTDYTGLAELVRSMGLDLSGSRVLIAGTGGTAKTAAALSKDLGAKTICMLSRSGREGALLYEEVYARQLEADLLIQTTPSGMSPLCGETPVDLSRMPGPAAIVDVIYHPLRTRLILESENRGILARGGLLMLVSQAMASAALFTGEPVGEAEKRQIFQSLLRERRNLVLIGMPGSGKTMLGALLAKRLGIAFTDTDEEIVKETGRSIPELFESPGEEVFRDLETKIIKGLAESGGRVIATGGGAILREENITALRANGLLIFLDRDVDALSPDGARPLADSVEKIHDLYHERLPLYKRAADLTVHVCGEPQETAAAICDAVKNYDRETWPE